jgi:hypothetical protein
VVRTNMDFKYKCMGGRKCGDTVVVGATFHRKSTKSNKLITAPVHHPDGTLIQPELHQKQMLKNGRRFRWPRGFHQ